jgi:hypothetical protein
MADKEIGSVLFAINSYVGCPGSLKPLLHTDQAFADYIRAFYCHLYFKVETLHDFSYEQLIVKLAQFVPNSVGTRIAVVFVGHGSLVEGKEYFCANNGHPILFSDIESLISNLCPAKNKYLFFDACRSDGTGDVSTNRMVYKASCDKTCVVYSALPFHVAWTGGTYGLWSHFFTRKITEPMELDDVVLSVDKSIRECGYDQKSEISKKGVVENPKLSSIASGENPKHPRRELSQSLCAFIDERKRIMDHYRANIPILNQPQELDGSTHPKNTPSANSPGREVNREPGPVDDQTDTPPLQPTPLKYFDPDEFMEKYPGFPKEVAALAICTKLKNKNVIGDDVAYNMEHTYEKKAAGFLYEHLKCRATTKNIRILCKVMIDDGKQGYPRMKSLGEKMLEDKDLDLPEKPAGSS